MNSKIKIYKLNINKINFNNKYDIVNCCSVIQYVNNWKKLVNDLA